MKDHSKMTDPTDLAPPYLAGRIKEALARDERTHMLDVTIRITGESLFLVGNVPSQDRRDLAERVAAELVCGRLRVVNALAVECYPDPADPEPLE
jgi:osmotically-inducible protein OsmY